MEASLFMVSYGSENTPGFYFAPAVCAIGILVGHYRARVGSEFLQLEEPAQYLYGSTVIKLRRCVFPVEHTSTI